jgi:hypothetical protein
LVSDLSDIKNIGKPKFIWSNPLMNQSLQKSGRKAYATGVISFDYPQDKEKPFPGERSRTMNLLAPGLSGRISGTTK